MLPTFLAAIEKLENASKSQDNFENWIDERLLNWIPDTNDTSSLYQLVVGLKQRDYKEVFAKSNFKSIQQLRNLFELLHQNETNKDFCINQLRDSKFAFVGGLSLLFLDPVIELALNRVRTYLFT